MLDDDQQEKIVKHYAKHFGMKQKDLIYFPEENNKGKKIDLFWAKPRKHFPFNTIATMGLSDYIIRGGSNEYVELMMILPPEWNPSLKEFENAWQVQFLKKVAHCIQNENIPVEYGLVFVDNEDGTISPECEMYAGLVVFPETYSPKIFSLKQGHGKVVKFFALTTLTKEEYDKAASKDIFDFIDEDLATDNGTDIFVFNTRNPRKTAVEKHEEIQKEGRITEIKDKSGGTKKVIIKKK